MSFDISAAFTLDSFLFFILGLLFGSFANVVILRLPQEQSVIRPRSRCPKCKNPIAFYDNIPVLSWLLLRGKCRKCENRISARYPLVELVTAVLFWALFLKFGWSYTLLEFLILGFGLVVISFIDLDHQIIPDSFSLSGIALGLVGASLNPEREFYSAVAGVLVGGGFLWLVAYTYWVIRNEEGMGGGDIKLLAWLGAYLGWVSIPFIILVSSVLGSIVGLALIKKGEGLKAAIPFGPFLVAGALIYIFGGNQVALWYLQLFFPWVESSYLNF